MSTYSDLPSGRYSPEPDDRREAGSPRESAPSPRKNSKKRRRRRGRNPVLVVIGWLFKIVGTLLLIGVVTGCFVACYGAIYIQTVIMPEAERFDLGSFTLNEPSTIYYTDKATGIPVAYATCVGAENRVILDADDIPLVFKDVAVAAEDKRFYRHKGVDWYRTAAAIFYMFTGHDIVGGSTITQQVIKNATQEDEVTVKRKVLEIFRALATENKYEKDDILAVYLNYIYLGGKNYGIAAAARYYFDKDVSEITLPEAASIIAITNNPSLFSPYSTVETRGSKGQILTGLERNKNRQEAILWSMCYDKDIALISEREYEAAINAPLNFTRGQTDAELAADEINSWYTDEVIGEVVKYFVSQGYTEKAAYGLIYSAGLHIYTPFDPDVQACVDEVYNDRSNLDYTSKDGQQMQSCITIVDNSNGYVVAMAGAVGEKTGNLLWNYATDTARQPGSCIKPLSVYAPAIEMGQITPYSIVDDTPYQMLNDNPWPVNAYEGFNYRGLTTITTAVHKSLNTVAVRVLSDYVTTQKSFQFMTDYLGITTLYDHVEINGKIFDDHEAAQLALGGLSRGLCPYEVAAAYATFPRGGVYTPPSVVLRVENRDHLTIWDNTPKKSYPIKESTAYYVNQLLQGVVNEGTGTNARINGMHVAGKTGTTSENYDLWFAGYTPYYTGVVWTGYNRNADISDHNCATTMWRLVMEKVHANLGDRDFFSVSNLNTYNICLDCGQRATEACANDLRGSRVESCSFVEGTQPSGFCTCHVAVTVCAGGEILDENGVLVPTGFCQPSPVCPADSQTTVYMVAHDRSNPAYERVNIADAGYMVSSYAALPICPYHGSGMAPIDPNDPNAWPSIDPGTWPSIDPGTWPSIDPSTWPSIDPSTWPSTDPGTSSEPGPSVSYDPGTGGLPAVSDPPAASETPVQTAPPGDAYVPAW